MTGFSVLGCYIPRTLVFSFCFSLFLPFYLLLRYFILRSLTTGYVTNHHQGVVTSSNLLPHSQFKSHSTCFIDRYASVCVCVHLFGCLYCLYFVVIYQIQLCECVKLLLVTFVICGLCRCSNLMFFCLG